jgi:hypothetical protein
MLTTVRFRSPPFTLRAKRNKAIPEIKAWKELTSAGFVVFARPR